MDSDTLLALAHAHQISSSKISDLCETLERMGWVPPDEASLSRVKTDENTLVIGAEFDDTPPLTHETIGRYLVKAKLDQGGMGSIYRVYDPELRRTLALKLVHRHMINYSDILSRFIEEAQLTAQLQHSNIIPVLDYGMLPNGQYYFTMPEIIGKTLNLTVSEIFSLQEQPLIKHQVHRLLEIFHQACKTVAYAHDKGVIHCDLKPDNIMIGPFREVFVLDWGVARILDKSNVSVFAEGYLPNTSRFAAVLGTPAYMAPEQARGDTESLCPQTDVYALGLILFYILTGKRAYAGEGGNTLENVRLGQMNTLEGPWVIPQPLIDIFSKATQSEIEKRFSDADEIANAIGRWLAGEQNEQRAKELHSRAMSQQPLKEQLNKEGKETISVAQEILKNIPPWEKESQRWEAWRNEDEGHKLLHLSRQAGYTMEQLLLSALHYSPDLNEIHESLSKLYAEQHKIAELAKESDELERLEGLLQFHVNALPLQHPTRVKYTHYIKGDGHLTLYTDPPGAHARLLRYGESNRRMVALPYQYLGKTPIINRSLPMGSFIIELEKPGHHSIRYPLHIKRLSHWDGIPPQSDKELEIWLPPLGSLKVEECYVPAGWFSCGGDDLAPDSMPLQEVWVDGFIIQSRSVNNRDYILFLNDLIDQGKDDDALKFAPRERASMGQEEGALIYGQYPDGSFFLTPDADGDQWDTNWPVLMVNWNCAKAYANWLETKTELPWRLPSEIEWEKSARGVDGRFFPWGNTFDPSRACVRHSHPTRQLPAAPNQYPLDISPYGLLSTAGNTADWCSDGYVPQRIIPEQIHKLSDEQTSLSSERVFRGGSWQSTENDSRLCKRSANPILTRSAWVGIRLCRSIKKV